MNTIIPYLLALFSLLNMLAIWLGRRAILRGNWFAHRNFMVGALISWALTLALFGFFLWATKLLSLIGTQMLFILYCALALATSLMLVVTLARVARHQLLPHKLLARKTIVVWLLTCLAGLVMFPLTDIHALM